MTQKEVPEELGELRKSFPEKFPSIEKAFTSIHRGDRIFISTACGEPQYLVDSMVRFVNSHPKAIFDAEILQVWSLGVAPYTDQKLSENFRPNTFFIGDPTRGPVNEGLADYTPIFLSQVPELFQKRMVPIDVALVQVCPPDKNGYMSLGVSVDITKSAIENASVVIAQVNRKVPRVHGDSFIHISDVDFLIPFDEDILEFRPEAPLEISDKIGKYVSRIVEDEDTIQIGYGSLPDAILKGLENKKHLGVHTELLGDGIVELLKKGVIDNSRKTIDRGKTVATFCMGTRETYDYIDDNPSIEFRTIDYTNNPLNIARIDNMTAINAGLEIDLTGQASAESIGKFFYSGIGGQADFMRGAVLAKSGKAILALPSTSEDGNNSRIVPLLREGAGVTLTRGDIHYVVTEYGIAYLHGRNIRNRAMELISIAHPKFQPWLIEEGKKLNLIYKDQAFIPQKGGRYPEELETYRTTKTGLEIFLRPVKISDEHLLKDFFYSLSDRTLFRRFISRRLDMHHERLQDFIAVDFSKRIIMLALLLEGEKEEVIGMGEIDIDKETLTGEVALVVKDEYQNMGVGTELLSYLTSIAKSRGLLAFTAEVALENNVMLHVFEKAFRVEKKVDDGMYFLKMDFE
ncbi:MAG: GNAT family N-acetyltransferase [Actinomycetota bacterium]|nr:GNAT family N-acetyltransferase [Actinomycetota bacterium]